MVHWLLELTLKEGFKKKSKIYSKTHMLKFEICKKKCSTNQ